MIVKTYEEMFNKKLTIRDLVENFNENTKTGEVNAFNGKLNVRPPYQREFVYEMDKQKAVIDTVVKGYPLNVMYWAKITDDRFELMDGQQRTLSICKYVKGAYSVEFEIGGKVVPKSFDYLGAKQKDFLDYPVTVYICEGNEDEILAWFRIINIAGIKLTDQEMRNAIYNGTWTTDAKKYFSRVDGEGFCSEGHCFNGHTYGDYVDVVGGNKKTEKENSVVRQKLLEIVLSWAVDKENKDRSLSGKDKITIDNYMDSHCKNPNAINLWRYYEDVMEWVKTTFPTYRDLMKKVDWGVLYNDYHSTSIKDADTKVNSILESSDEISNIKEVYKAVLSGEMKFLNARAFDERDKKWAYEKQNHKCPYCKGDFEYKEMHGDHIVPWSKGGKTERTNLQMLCTACNIKKSAHDVKYHPWEKNSYEKFDLEEWDKNN